MQGRWDARRFAGLLNAAIEATGLSQHNVAALSGLNATQLSRWRHGQARPSYDSLARLTAALAREVPALAEQIPALFATAGYGSPIQEMDALPEVISDHWNDRDPQIRDGVREIWDLHTIDPATRATFAAELVRQRAGQDSQQDRQAS